MAASRAAEMNRIAAASTTDDLLKPCEAAAAQRGWLDPLLDGMHFCPVKFSAANGSRVALYSVRAKRCNFRQTSEVEFA